MMHILVAAQTWAHSGHDAQSANQVMFELIKGFRDTGDCEVSFVCACNSAENPDPATEERGRKSLDKLGVHIVPPLAFSAVASPHGLRSLFIPRPEDFWPEIRYRPWANDLVETIKADAVVVPWSERVTPVFSESPCLRVAYYGDPDPKNLRFMTMPPIEPSRGPIRDAVRSFRISQFEHRHLAMMRRYHLLGEVAANDVAYYRKNGIADAFYVRIPYADRCPADWIGVRDALDTAAPRRIVANIGSQRSTGNVLALRYLADEILDRLDRRLDGAYEIHLYGGKGMPADLAEKLDRPTVRNVGFVEDVDQALMAAPIFLCLNNATPYKVNQSRYMHAWSLGACIVAHSDAALSLPEMVDGENALLGGDPDAIVERIARALGDRSLRRRIGAAGRAMFLAHFTGAAVAADLMQRMRRALAASDAATSRESQLSVQPEGARL
jgi:hypothetical protein